MAGGRESRGTVVWMEIKTGVLVQTISHAAHCVSIQECFYLKPSVTDCWRCLWRRKTR